jgi:hypothetical protein
MSRSISIQVGDHWTQASCLECGETRRHHIGSFRPELFSFEFVCCCSNKTEEREKEILCAYTELLGKKNQEINALKDRNLALLGQQSDFGRRHLALLDEIERLKNQHPKPEEDSDHRREIRALIREMMDEDVRRGWE